MVRAVKFREGEKVLASLKPHSLAFLDFYALFAYLVSIGALFWIFEQQITDAIKNIFPTGWSVDWGIQAIFIIFWFVCLMIPFLVVGVLKITWRWFFLSIGIGALGAALKFYFDKIHGLQTMSILIGTLGFILVDVYRRGFNFYITDQRILVELKFISQKRREILYSKISDLVVERGWLGRIFNYGSVIPVTESGFGLGEDISAVTVGATGSPLPKGPKITTAVSGGRTVSVPRGRSFYVLFGVRKPNEVSEMISQQIRGYEEAPYLKKIAAGVETLVKKEEEKEESNQST